MEHISVHTVHTVRTEEPESHSRSAVSLKAARAEFDRAYLRRLLHATGGNIRRAAEIAEIHPKSFSRLMRRRGLRRS